jgi:hypothetical protein
MTARAHGLPHGLPHGFEAMQVFENKANRTGARVLTRACVREKNARAGGERAGLARARARARICITRAPVRLSAINKLEAVNPCGNPCGPVRPPGGLPWWAR